MGKKKAKTRRTVPAGGSVATFAQTMREWNIYEHRLLQMVITMFEWKNLPPEIPEYAIERLLAIDGAVLIAHTPVDKYIACRFGLKCQNDIYNEPTKVYAVAPNNILETYDEKTRKLVRNNTEKLLGSYDRSNSVIVYNNDLRMPSMPIICDYAAKLAEHEEIYTVNLKAQKTPVLLTGDKAVSLSLKNMYKSYEGNEPCIFASDYMTTANPLNVLKTDAPFISAELLNLKKQIFNEACSTLGINNVDTEKRERAVTAEATGNMQQVELVRQSMLRPRRRACEQLNKLFGLDIQCDFRLKMPLPAHGGGFSSGLDAQSLSGTTVVDEGAQNILTGGSEPHG